MPKLNHASLLRLFELHPKNEEAALLKDQLEAITARHQHLKQLEPIIHIYQDAAALLQQSLWTTTSNDELLDLYQSLYREMEEHIALTGDDERHSFIIVIPVADRPKHLESCLGSLLTLCKSFHYGGIKDGRYTKVSAIIADDSKSRSNIEKHKSLTANFSQEGLDITYYGIEEQLESIEELTAKDQKNLYNILGDIDKNNFYHKGASRMRNITYLKLLEHAENNPRTLFYFIDSDQEFQVKLLANKTETDLYAINYFHELDQLFSTKDIDILTGKVVGDPPVSPAVMAGTFLDDISAFLNNMSKLKSDDECSFHNEARHNAGDAAYHDMADLFGFKQSTDTYAYKCDLNGSHTHANTFEGFAKKLNHFFYGEHPTRKSYFDVETPTSAIQAARTIYTGNYIFNPKGLEYFIPFSNLKLRMAGPVLGRIIKSEIGAAFVSANLPMLHKRTLEEIGESEFRPGIENKMSHIDLSGELERQYYGDVMLFTIERLTDLGYPAKALTLTDTTKALEITEKDLRQKYTEKQSLILEKLGSLKSIFSNEDYWWNKAGHHESAKLNISNFINNIEHNFKLDAAGYQLIFSQRHREQRIKEMSDAIVQHHQDRVTWDRLLANTKTISD